MGAATTKRMTAQEFNLALARAQQGTWIDKKLLYDEVYYYAHSLVKGQYRWAFAQDPDDAAQQICLRMLENTTWITQYDPSKEALPFVLTVIRRSAFRIMRDQKAQKRDGKAEEFDPEIEYESTDYNYHVLAEECVTKDEKLTALLSFLDGLSPRDREIMERRGLKEIPAKKVAEPLGISAKNVDTIYARLRVRFKKYFQKNRGALSILLLFLPMLSWSLFTVGNG